MEFTAQPKISCPSCGGEAQWNPARQALVCPFCGTVTPMKPPTVGAIQEHSLSEGLATTADAKGWDAAKKSVRCQSCGAISVFDPERVSQRCDFCGSSALVPYTETQAPIRPESLLELKVSETQVRESLRVWYGSHFWAPNALKSQSLTDTVKGIYLPYWTFDGRTHSDWTADAGYYYYETEHYKDAEGKDQTRQVQHTRWESESGSINRKFDDFLVSASKGVQRDLLNQIEPFPTTTDLKPYDPAFLSGWVVEQYQVELKEAALEMQNHIRSEVHSLCSADVPGDTQRFLNVETRFYDQTFKHILVPVWLLTYTYGASSYQVVVNGYTGRIAGKFPLSFWKRFSVVAIIAFICLAIYLYVASMMR